MKAQKHESLEPIFEAISASNQKIFGKYFNSLLPFGIDKSVKTENGFCRPIYQCAILPPLAMQQRTITAPLTLLLTCALF